MSRFGDDSRGDRDEHSQPERSEWDLERARAIQTERREPARLIWQAWERELTHEELDRVRDFVALRMFDPVREVPVPEELWYVEYEGHVYQPGDRELTGTIHYLKHAVSLREWPDGTTEEQYYRDLQAIIFDERSGVFLNRLYDAESDVYLPQLGFIGSTDEDMRGPAGRSELLIEHRLDTQHWATGYQLDRARDKIERGARIGIRRDLKWIS